MKEVLFYYGSEDRNARSDRYIDVIVDLARQRTKNVILNLKLMFRFL